MILQLEMFIAHRLLVARGQRAQNAHGFMREALPKIKTGKLHAGCGARKSCGQEQGDGV